MATLVQAVAKYGPRIIRTRTAGTEDVVSFMAKGTGINYHDVQRILGFLHDALIHFTSAGQGVKVTGLGTFGSSIDRDGRINVTYFPDTRLRAALNDESSREIQVRNRRNIGLDDAGYKALWDAEHPDDPVELPARRNPKGVKKPKPGTFGLRTVK